MRNLLQLDPPLLAWIAEAAAIVFGLAAMGFAMLAVWLAASGRGLRRQMKRDPNADLERREEELIAAERRGRAIGSEMLARSELIAARSERQPARESLPALPDGKKPQEIGLGKTILIADDDPDITHAFALRLKALGFTSLRSPDAMHALLGVHRIRPDLVIMDVKMPSGSGLAVCEMLVHDRERAGIPVIVLTGLSDAATVKRCEEIGVHYVLKSPEAWAQVKSLILTLLHLDSGETGAVLAGVGQATSESLPQEEPFAARSAGEHAEGSPDGRPRKHHRDPGKAGS
jgi:CheY-like chemotaxis protein